MLYFLGLGLLMATVVWLSALSEVNPSGLWQQILPSGADYSNEINEFGQLLREL
jgi:hypothetical protein